MQPHPQPTRTARPAPAARRHCDRRTTSTAAGHAQRRRDPGRPAELAELVAGLIAGDQTAWERVVRDYGGLLAAIARAQGLKPAEAAEVAQTTWLRLVERVHTLRAPEALGAWLATTARREAAHLRQLAGRQTLVADEDSIELQAARPADPPVDASLLGSERDAAVRRAVGTLSGSCQELLGLLMADPPPSYATISAKLGMPVGSIGPIRGRCLACLRANRELLSFR